MLVLAQGSASLTIVQQVLLTVLTTLLSTLAALLIAARTEWFRKLAGWEPLAQEVWKEKLAIYKSITSAIGQVRASGYAAQQWFVKDQHIASVPAHQNKLYNKLEDRLLELNNLLNEEPMFVETKAYSAALKIAMKGRELLDCVKQSAPSRLTIGQSEEALLAMERQFSTYLKCVSEALGIEHIERAWEERVRLAANTFVEGKAKAPPQSSCTDNAPAGEPVNPTSQDTGNQTHQG